MAHGYTMITGRPQVVMVHTVPGTANAIGGFVNAARSKVPMLFSASRTPITKGEARGSRDGSIHWAQESFDQAAMVHEWVKWDYELRHGADLESLVDRAFAIAESPPAGPVYLTLPREVLAEEIDGLSYRDASRQQKAGDRLPTPEAIAQAARVLAGARNPILVTRGGGKDPRAVATLVELAELLGMAVFESGALYANFPRNHALYAGSDIGSALADADAVVVLEADVPWTPKRHQPAEGSQVIGIGDDPLFSSYPVRGFQVDLNLAGTPSLVLQALADAVSEIEVDAPTVKKRTDEWERRTDEMRAGWLRQAKAASEQHPSANRGSPGACPTCWTTIPSY